MIFIIDNNWLKEIRENRGLSQKKCSNELGISQQMLSAIETNRRRPSVDLAQKISEFLDFDWKLFYEKPDASVVDGAEHTA